MTAKDNDMDECCNKNVEQKKPDAREYIIWDSIYIKFKTTKILL